MRAGRGVLVRWFAAGCCLAPAAASASAAPATPLAALPQVASRLTAFDGWVVFSERSGQGNWSLMAWHAGAIAALPVATRTIPFDAQAGPGPDGRPVVVFSKCTREPRTRGSDPESAAQVEWQTASGCRIYELSPAGGAPRLVTTIRPPRGAFDATPAISRGEIAFARYGRPGGPQLLLSDGHLARRLGGGPTSCPAPSTIPGAPLCGRGEHLARPRVAGISLSAGAAVYEWVAEVPGAFVGPSADPEIRIDPLRGGRQSGATKLLSLSFASGACGGSSSSSPNAAGGKALFVTSTFVCEPAPERLTSTFELAPPLGRARSSGTGGHRLALAVAWDRGTAYWIGLVPTPQAPCTENQTCERQEAERAAECPAQSVCDSARQLAEPFACEPAQGTCTLMRTSGLATASAASTGGVRARRSRPGSRLAAARH